MIKKIISFVVLFLTLLNIPTIVLETLSISISSPISYLLFSLLVFLIFTSKIKYPKTVIILAITASLYFLISALQYNGDYIILIIIYIKFLLYLFGLYIAIRNIDQNIIIVFLLLGAITILLDTLYFRFNDFQGIGYVSQYGRYAGFYLNPNTASMICLFGYAITITKENYWKFISILFTFFGFLTLSRTFMATWFLISIIYLFYNRKYIVKSFLFLIVAVFSLITFSEDLKLDARRFEFLVNLFSGQIDNQVLNDDSRQDQWSKFFDLIIESPIIGNGFQTFSTSLTDKNMQGVHNSFLLIIGESGFLPFLLIIMVFFFLFKKSYNLRKKNLTLLLLMFVLFIQFLVSHNFFDTGLMLFIFLNIIYVLDLNYNKRII
tara:strand:- start:173 stop:1306 length:1134 start_codon:yes stop_codon:yes gene_type:complete